jgi:photosystem II stability/assembly factor-like uncharacterized protein
MPKEIDLSRLHKNITQYFDEGELKTLCFDLQVDYDDLPAVGKTNKARELITYCQRLNRLEQLTYKCSQLRPHADWQTITTVDLELSPPFKGLKYFEENDAEIFFGRQVLVDKLIGHVYANRFLAIVGASGSGKSSVVRAGLIPAIKRGHQVADIHRPRDSTAWPIHVITPKSHPLDELATALTPNHESLTYTADLRSALENNPHSLRLQARKILNESEAEHLLLVIDQFEELFTLCSDSERKAFLDCVFATIDSETYETTIIIIVLRADFYNSCLAYEPLRTLLEQKQIIVGDMLTDELRQAIEEPASTYSVEIEHGLTEELLHDIGNEPGALPLLSHALLETWKRRDKEKNMLTFTGYINAGRVQGAIANSANTVFQQLTEKQQTIARNIFLSLMEIGEETPPTRKRAILDGLTSHPGYEKDARQILQILVNERLLTVSSARNKVFVEVSHEALLREWTILNDWIAEYHEQLWLRRLLNRDAQEWETNSRNSSYLYSDDKLAKVSQVFHKIDRHKGREIEAYAVSLNELENSFLEASIQADNEKQATVRRQRFRWIGFVTFLLLIVGLLQIEWYGGQWEKLAGIDGSNVTAIAIYPESVPTIYVAVEGKDESVLFKSNDNGHSWIRLDQGLHKIRINDILIDPIMPEIVYVGTEGGGVFKSIDGGDTWSSTNDGLRTFSVRKLVIHPDDNDSTLYLATYGRDGGVYKSESGGLSWQFIGQGLPSPHITDLSINLNGILFAATEDDGIYLSVNGGTSWEPTALTAINARQVVVDSLNPQVVYAGTRSRGMFKSSDGGMTWQPINNGLPDEKQITAVEVSLQHPPTIYITLNTRGGNHLYISHDQGNSWNSVIHPGAGGHVNQLLKLDGESDVLYVASRSGLFSYEENQNRSQRLSIDYYQINASDIALSSDNSTIYVSVYGGVFRSQDGGETWSFSNMGLTHPIIRTLAPDPVDNSRVYVGTFSDRTPDAIFVSIDQGLTWHPLTSTENALPDDDVRAIAINPQDTQILYVGTFGSGVFKSINQGETWDPINSGITRFEITGLKIDSSNPDNVFAIAAGGPVYRTADGGKTWQAIPETTNKDIRDIIVDDSRICIVVYGQQQGNFQCSQDSGLTWHDSNQGLASRFINQLETSVSNPGYLYAGTSDQGVFLSRDNGQNWQAINMELANGSVTSLVAKSNSEIIFSIVAGEGVFTFQEQYIWER